MDLAGDRRRRNPPSHDQPRGAPATNWRLFFSTVLSIAARVSLAGNALHAAVSRPLARTLRNLRLLAISCPATSMVSNGSMYRNPTGLTCKNRAYEGDPLAGLSVCSTASKAILTVSSRVTWSAGSGAEANSLISGSGSQGPTYLRRVPLARSMSRQTRPATETSRPERQMFAGGL